MTTALTRYAWRQLTHHRARTAFTVASLAAAVVGTWLFAAPRDFDAAMDERVDSQLLHDLVLRPDGVALADDDLAALREIPNVAGLEARTTHITELRIGDRIQDVWLIGVLDFADQQVNVVDVAHGDAPRFDGGSLEALTDPVNDLHGRAAGRVGDVVQLRTASGAWEDTTITGEGSSIYFSHNASDWIPVLYMPAEAVWELAPFDRLFTEIDVRVGRRDDAVLAATIDAIRDGLADVKPNVGYNALVDIRPAGEWPGQDDFDNFQVLFWVIAGVSVFSALVLVASTMTTLAREQAREIGIMKSIGGRRRQILATYLATSALLGVGGTVIGTAIGLPVANLLTNYLGRFQGVEPGWRVSGLALASSAVVGIGATLLASVPPLLRGTRITVREALGQPGSDASFGASRVDRLTTRGRWLPRTAQLGLRAAGRRRTRSIATQLQIALAVGTLLGFASLAITLIEVSEESRAAEGGDIEVYGFGSGRRLGTRAAEQIAQIEGVDSVQPTVGADLLVGDTETFAWGLPADPVFGYQLSEGRWFTEAENDARSHVAVVGPALATIHDLSVGDSVRADTLSGPVDLEVVGIDSTMVGDGRALFVPIDTALALSEREEPSWFWVTTTSRDTAAIDRVHVEIRELLDRERYAYGADVRYIEREADRAEDRIVVTIIMSMGIPIVAMGMIGLVSAMTTNIVERTREIGILRSIGARARDIRRVFLAEAVVLVVLGWLLGIAFGYAIGRIILHAMGNAFDVTFTLRYPLWPIAVTLVLTLLVAVLVLRRPLRRAGRLPPSVALRYE
ncbi:MAG: FtsX-like permease family protein [Ilumatobacter sp.]|uniref:ABC transporter permease n=1 Tax=Ilumatobacter sp. TaxID=1967498 RepID=UPI002634A432|nr:FtsX-like permease family protein [Ilumatobacter sp.]MDJ0767806.1 FtsX-like permease family protein [Ilumatobacter sp.]